MENCVFPVEILEIIANYDVLVAWTIKATCRELKMLRTQIKLTKAHNVFKHYKHTTVSRIVYVDDVGNAVDYFNLGDWHIHNYYDKSGDVYEKIKFYNYRLAIYEVFDVHKQRHSYFNLSRKVLDMTPKMPRLGGFDYTYYVYKDNELKYYIMIKVRPSCRIATWYSLKLNQ